MVVGCMLSHLWRWWKWLEVERLEKFCDLSACPEPGLTLHACIADKNYVNLAKQRPQMPQCSFNTLILESHIKILK